MYTHLGEVTLTSGERMAIGVVDCPDPAWAGQVESLLGHKGPEWRHHIGTALRGRLDGLETRFYLGTIDGQAVTNVMIVGTRGTGILGHVYTSPGHRRKGAYSRLMAVQMEHSRGVGYRILTLGTGFETPPYWIYHRFGFRSIDGVSGRMKWLATPAAEADWFRPGTTRVRPMRWGDWGALNLVAYGLTAPDEELPRSWVFRLKGHGSLEGSFVAWQADLPLESPRTVEEAHQAVVELGRPAALVLETEHGAVVGWAAVKPDDLALREAWLLDCYVHPDFRQAAGQLLAAIPRPPGRRMVAYSGAPDGYRAAALQAAGFRIVAELPDWIVPPPAGSGEDPGRGAVPLRVFVRDAAPS
jgi:GNAT superfamily N-acetyltransferase